ncbi:hypothetical protein WH95_01660 [Kiloniella litopenaei]|uniref:Phage-Barnase-EndoU-ColicinE5/D-RelE-like nuclease domain-containing protein n=1 Tax=Kiloniella litopenaei TaxID=1549748 RepID=A0A0M2RGV4_9PROT|nr:hypothetical protein [Kiloniella litopenaei]KKJ78798.1 hypothetical protein WH95_01660 [Kiloniella litopenaei]
MVQVIDHAEKLYGKPEIVQKAKRPRYQATPLEQNVQRWFGLEPGPRETVLIPKPAITFKNGKRTRDWSNLKAPSLLYDLAKAVALPGHVLEGGSYTHQDTVDAAFNMVGGGFLSGAAVPKATTRGSAILSMNGARTPFYKRSTSTVREFSDEIAKVLETKTSSKGKVFREDLGEISIDFGDSKAGLQHIIKQRTEKDGINGEAFVRERLPKILAKGKLTRFDGDFGERRATIETKNELVRLSLMRYDKKETWLITAFEKW